MTLDPAATDKPGAPEALHVIQVGSDRATLEWEPPRETGGAPVLSYAVETRELTTGSVTRSALGFTRAGKVQPRAGEPLRFTLQRLRAGASFAARVLAANECGEGEPAELSEPILVLPALGTCTEMPSLYPLRICL